MAWRQLPLPPYGHLHAMAPIAPLQCLFCKHLNSAGASFCNECGSQLNLQPCGRCDAIDNRAATNCYKCGAEFNLPAAPEPDSLIAPAILDKDVTDPALNDAAGAGPEDAHPNHDPTHSSLAFQPVDETVLSEIGVTATGSRRGWLVAVAALLLALIAIPVYFYYGQSAKLAQKQGVKQLGPGVSGAPKPGGDTHSIVAAQADSALKPTDKVPKPVRGTEGLEKAPSLAPSSAGATLTKRPLPATDAEVKARQDPPVLKVCPQAVATLGLCNPGR